MIQRNQQEKAQALRDLDHVVVAFRRENLQLTALPSDLRVMLRSNHELSRRVALATINVSKDFVDNLSEQQRRGDRIELFVQLAMRIAAAAEAAQ